MVLPPWARDGQDFLHKMAQALESRHVSARLHKWINLVFGYKSRGQRAEEADNVFHYLTYDEMYDWFVSVGVGRRGLEWVGGWRSCMFRPDAAGSNVLPLGRCGVSGGVDHGGYRGPRWLDAPASRDV